MKNLITQFLIRLHRESFKKLHIPDDINDWPHSWKRIQYKNYTRMESVTLPPIDSIDAVFGSVLEKRVSTRRFSKKSISLDTLSTLLGYSLGKKKLFPEAEGDPEYRTYASGGALYPLETYIVVSNVDSIEPGLYHYNVDQHVLQKLPGLGTPAKIKSLLYEWAKPAPVLILNSIVWERNLQKYGDYGYNIALIEVGHAAQNIQLVCASLGLDACSFVGFDEEKIDELLEIGLIRGETSKYITAIGYG